MRMMKPSQSPSGTAPPQGEPREMKGDSDICQDVFAGREGVVGANDKPLPGMGVRS